MNFYIWTKEFSWGDAQLCFSFIVFQKILVPLVHIVPLLHFVGTIWNWRTLSSDFPFFFFLRTWANCFNMVIQTTSCQFKVPDPHAWNVLSCFWTPAKMEENVIFHYFISHMNLDIDWKQEMITQCVNPLSNSFNCSKSPQDLLAPHIENPF